MADKDKAKTELETKADEVAQLKADLAARAAEASVLAAEVARLRAAQVSGQAAADPGTPKPLPEKYKGTKTYILGASHYRLGVTYEKGEEITVTDEIPSKTWTLKPEPGAALAVAPAPVLPVPASRPSDKGI